MNSIILSDMSMWNLAHRHAHIIFCKIYIVHFCPIIGTTFSVHSPTCHAACIKICTGTFDTFGTFLQKVKLQIKHGRCHWTVYTRGEWEYDEPIEQEYKLGDQLKMFGFYDYRITEITDDHIVIESNDDKRILTHEKPVYIVTEIEGREWSDGCVYDGEDYSTEISWL